jgi:hypothetical protein
MSSSLKHNMRNKMRNNMNKETKTFSLSLDSAQLAILEDALSDLKVHFNNAPQPLAWDTIHREWEYSADTCTNSESAYMADVEELRAMFSAMLKAEG